MTFTPSVRAYTMLLFIFVFFLPLFIIIYCYVFIFRAIRTTNRSVSVNTGRGFEGGVFVCVQTCVCVSSGP